MQETCVMAGNFLESLFTGTGLNVKVAVTETPSECLLDLSGPDADMLQVEGGELLHAGQHLVNQAFGRKLAEGQRLVCDVEGFRATREAELRKMANLAAERVPPLGVPFTFCEINCR